MIWTSAAWPSWQASRTDEQLAGETGSAGSGRAHGVENPSEWFGGSRAQRPNLAGLPQGVQKIPKSRALAEPSDLGSLSGELGRLAGIIVEVA
jgi:hypothetical protein